MVSQNTLSLLTIAHQFIEAAPAPPEEVKPNLGEVIAYHEAWKNFEQLINDALGIPVERAGQPGCRP